MVAYFEQGYRDLSKQLSLSTLVLVFAEHGEVQGVMDVSNVAMESEAALSGTFLLRTSFMTVCELQLLKTGIILRLTSKRFCPTLERLTL